MKHARKGRCVPNNEMEIGSTPWNSSRLCLRCDAQGPVDERHQMAAAE